MWNSHLLEYVERQPIGIGRIPTYWNRWHGEPVNEYFQENNVYLLLTIHITLCQQYININSK
jgi:hypothetical protein